MWDTFVMTPLLSSHLNVELASSPSGAARGLPLNYLSAGILTRKFAFPLEPPIPAVIAKILSESLDKVMTAIPLWLAKPRFSAHC